ncbi:MAG: YbhB/YbcL family Raf kinase inhibitor-like protein [Candidatus Moeniiplasma glomeromycotorum]|nr:YbhB/YbcL family Raf kinase inhibitor-like protein [Candidatus Moeniiplasma glomeromycotorum]MCE8167402.1 YbhB/YbcL family Raf kinase inhibitor-like protein [Candidatus Moeniiplasma glomeromycotorum]MCE8168584.1 YbhB/YbcL family Raf kinase inhibitor-like protein [Candidatus Moeniiplasma glomeromycotorum]
MKLTSSAFTHQTSLPSRYTCDGKNVSPPLTWSEIPPATQSLVLIMDDPDAPGGTWDHWIIFNLPPNLNSLPEGINQFPSGTKLGKNSWGQTEYGGPCPPDRQHRYFFKLYALNTVLDLPPGASKSQIQQALKGKIIEKTELIGLYARPGQKAWNH